MVSGRGTIIGVTVNRHQWHPDFTPPYVIAVVALAEEPTVRLTTNIVGADPDQVSIGQEVMVTFEHQEDVWLPLFTLTGETSAVDVVPEPSYPTPRPPLRTSGSSMSRCFRASDARPSGVASWSIRCP